MNGYLIDFRFIKNQEIVSLKEKLGIECISFARKAPQLNVEYQEFSGSNGSREVEKVSNRSLSKWNFMLNSKICMTIN